MSDGQVEVSMEETVVLEVSRQETVDVVKDLREKKVDFRDETPLNPAK